MNESSSFRNPLWSLLPLAIVASGLTGLGDTGWAWFMEGGARVRDLGYSWLLRKCFHSFGVDPFYPLPDALNRFEMLDTLPAVIRLACFSVLTNALGACLILALVGAISLPLRRLRSQSFSAPDPATYPGIFLVFLAPLPMHWFSDLGVRGLGLGPSQGGVVVGGITVLLLSTLVRRLSPSALKMHSWIKVTGWGVVAFLMVGLAMLVAEAGSPLAHKSIQSERTAAERPNILLISIDSLRSDHLESYGYFRETSPQLTELAREGVLFENAISPSSWTLPSHITLLTGLPPERHGVSNDGTRLVATATTLPEVFRDNGYRTAGFVSGPYLRAEYGFSQGFESYDDYTALRTTTGEGHSAITSPLLLEQSSQWLQNWHANSERGPFFLFLHMWDVHYDFIPPAPFDQLFDPDYDGNLIATDFETSPFIHPNMAARDLEYLVALYDGEIRYTDHHLGQLFDILKRLVVFDDTIVVVTADHGEEFFEHGAKGHRKTLYDEVLRIPLILRFPKRLEGGMRIEEQVQLMDVAPTLLELSGLDPSLLLKPNGLDPRQAWAPQVLPLGLTQTGGTVPTSRVAFGDLHGRLAFARTLDFKLILNLASSRAEFFDLREDPSESRNISAESHSDQRTFLAENLQAWRAALEGGSHAERVVLDEEQLELLRSLGYVK